MKGTNKYYPPDFDPAKHGSLNGYHKTHALRERARKLSQGILIIRFEMPYNIWCDGCKNHIGMGNGVQFDLKPTCDYLIVSGARRKEERWDMAENEQILTTEHTEKEKLETDAMFKLDHRGKDKEKLKKALPSLSEIQEYQSGWKDDFQLNSALRRKFRMEKKVQAEQEKNDDAVRMRTNLSIPLVPEKEEDKKLAALLTYQAPDCKYQRNTHTHTQHSKRKEISSRSWFSATSATPGGAAGSLLHKLSLQGKEAAVAKALSSPHSPLIRKRTEPCATVIRRLSQPELNTCDGEVSEVSQRQEVLSSSPLRVGQERKETNDCMETYVRTTKEAGEGLTEAAEQNRGLRTVISLVADYSDSDSDPGQ
uniref:Probable splicing factor YJU2B n=1 Tax=Mola mola TaxID=94237 RepID=A0A3Q3XJG9_MOLML